MGVSRRGFTAVLAGFPVMVVVSGCGDGYEDEDADVVVRGNHPLGVEHFLTFRAADAGNLAVDIPVRLQGNALHGHEMVIPAVKLQQLAAGQAIIVTAPASAEENGGDHTHEVELRRFTD